MKTPAIWANPSGTGNAGTSAGEYIDTQDLFDLSTQSGDLLIVDAGGSTNKVTSLWAQADKTAQNWKIDGYSQATNFGTAQERITVSSETRVTESGDVRIEEDAYEAIKPLSAWCAL